MLQNTFTITTKGKSLKQIAKEIQESLDAANSTKSPTPVVRSISLNKKAKRNKIKEDKYIETDQFDPLVENYLTKKTVKFLREELNCKAKIFLKVQ